LPSFELGSFLPLFSLLLFSIFILVLYIDNNLTRLPFDSPINGSALSKASWYHSNLPRGPPLHICHPIPLHSPHPIPQPATPTISFYHQSPTSCHFLHSVFHSPCYPSCYPLLDSCIWFYGQNMVGMWQTLFSFCLFFIIYFLCSLFLLTL
jgi:hypothetical protein